MMIRIILFAAYCGCAALAFPPQSVAQALAMKAPIEGLVDMQDISFYRQVGGQPAFTLGNVIKFPGQFGGIVLNVTWQELQPTENGPLFTLPIDVALGMVRAYNRQNTAPLGVKLRIWGGFMAPDWAKNLAGGAVPIPVPVHGEPETLGRYWTAPYRNAWRALQSQLADRYDPESLIREVSVTSCAWATDEPFVQWIDPVSGNINPNFTFLSQAGYTAETEFNCLQNSLSDYAGWKTTYLDFPFNPLQMYLPEKDTGSMRDCQHPTYGNDLKFCSSEDLSKSVMIECWQSKRCILSNQALAKTSHQTFPYDFIDTIYNVDHDVPIDFQTASPQSVNGAAALCSAVETARTYHARSVELWPSAFTSLSAPQIATLASVMNGQGSCNAVNR